MAFTKIQEYLSDGPGAQAGALLIPKLILPTMIEELNKVLLPRTLAAYVLGPEQIAGNQVVVNLETINSGKIRQIGEGAEIPMDNQAYEAVTYTPKKYGIAIRITRELMEDSQFELLQRNLRMAGRRFAENETKLILLTLDGAGTTVSGGSAITISNITVAMQNLWDNDFAPTDIIVGTKVLQDLMNIDTFAEANKWGDTTSVNRTGQLSRIYGLNVHTFSPNASPAASTYKKYAYVLDKDQAYGIAIKRDVSIENFDLPTYDMSGAVATMRLDVELLRSNAVCKITTT